MSTERWWEDDQTVAGPAPVAPVAAAPAADWGADDPVVEEPWQRIAREQPLELDPNLQFDGYQSLGGDAGFRRESDGVQTLPTVTVTAPRPERPLMERLGDIQKRHSRAFGRGASSLISGPLATLGDLIETTVQDPLRRVMTGLTPGDTRTAEAYADPLRAQATRDEALAAAQQAAAERQSDLEAIGGRPTIPEMATDPVLAVDYLGSMVAESLPAMGATVATGGLAGATAGAAVMGGATGASQYADALSAGQSRPEAAAEAVLSAMAETAGELPGLTGLLNPGRRLAGVGLEAVGEAGTQLAQTNTQDQLRGTETPVLEQLRQALDAGLVGAGVSAPFAAVGAAADAANPPVAPPTPQEIGAEQVAQAISAQQAGDVAAAGPQANPLAAAIQSVLAGVDTAAPPGVQDARPQSAGVPIGETRGQQAEEVRQGEDRQVAGGAAPGRAGQEEAVQAEVAPAVVQPLAPRVPSTPEVPSDLTLEQARAAYDLAQTDVERSTAAARIAAVQARDAAASAPAVPAPAQDAGQPVTGSQGGPQDDSGAGAVRTAEPAVPAAAAAQDMGLASGPEAAAGVAPQLRNTGAVTDAYTDTADPDIQAALGTAARGITVHRSPADLRPEDRQRLRFTDEDMTSVEGVYDPDTGRVHIFEGNLDKSMPAPQRKAWVAAHERSGHAGLRGMFADAEGSNAGGRKALLTQLERASQNQTINAIAEAMRGQRPETGPILFEEAIVEVAAAVRTGNYDHIRERYGVDVPPAARAGIEGYIRRLIEQLKRAFGKSGEAFSDADLFKLIEDSHRYAARGEVRGTSARAETGPVAQRAFHGTPTKGISTFDLNKIGTGEGNQAFGWGMYFAGRREIADFYRRGLSAVGRTRGGTIADQLLQKHGDRRTALEVISRLRRGTLEQAERMLERRSGKSWPDKEALLKELDGAEAFIRSDSNRGQLYQQEVPEDNELLDWDAPLSQQPPAVRAALRKVRGGPLFRESMQDFEDSKGVSIYNSLASDFGSDQDASEVLREAGIPGLRYADGSSRLASENKSYNYVIWDQQRIGEPEGLIASRTSSGILRNLTPAEQRKVTDKVAAKIATHLSSMPSANEMAAVAAAGEPKRGWYRQSAEAISAVFGPDAPRFAGLLAAMSPQTSVESNLRNALNTWVNWDAAGRPQDREAIIDVMGESVEGSRGRASVLGAWINNSVRALTAEDPAAIMLSGPKVDSFMRNLLGNVEEVTNDAWMASYAAVEQKIFSGGLLASGKDPGKGSGYLAMNALVRDTARRLTKLTGETWTPAEVQETVWSWAKTLYELADSATEIRTARELVQDRAVTAELLQATPDFGTLFADPEYAGILEEAGYGEQIKQIRAGRDAARQAGQESGTRRKAEPFAPEAQRRYEERAAARLDALRKQRLEAERVTDVTEAEEDIPFSRKRTVNVYGPDQGTDLAGLPMRVRVGDRGVVEFHGYAPAQQIAQKYAQRHGNAMPTTYAQVDEARAKRIADAYERMAHAPEDPEVKRAYRAMIDETLEQYRDVLKTGLEIEFITGEDPYTNGPRDAILDVVENNHLWVYPTRSGFGTKEDFDPANNPLLEETEFEISGQPALANDIFRAVHDYFGHIANGVGFRADGEENAWREHSAMYSPLARRAMTSETRGQNSWLNYGPHGEANRTAKTEDTVFADQKTGLMPAWVSEDGAGDEVVASRGFSAKKRQPDAVSVDAYHYSPRAGLKALDTSFAGTVAAGRERRRFGMGRFGENGGTAARLGFYVREPGEPVPAPERVVSAAGAANVYRVQLDNLYDGINDPRNIIEDANGNVDLMEEEISDAGFDGFLAPAVPGIDVPTAIVFDIGKKKIPVEAVDEELVASRRQTDTPEFKRWFGDSKVVDENGDPLIVYHGTRQAWDRMRSGDERLSAFDKNTRGIGFDVSTERGIIERTGAAVWFTDDEGVADGYRDSYEDESRTIPAYLSLQNPLDLRPESVGFDEVDDILLAAGLGAASTVYGRERGIAHAVVRDNSKLIQYAEKNGFDGLIYPDTDIRGRGLHTSYVALKPGQVKDAERNSGAFDPNDPSIIASRVTPAQKRAERQQLLGHLSTQGFPGGQPIQLAAGTGPLAKIGEVADALRIKLQDKMLPVLRAQEATGARNKPGVTSLTLDDAQNAYRLETLMHGAVKDIIDGGDKRYLTPLQGRLKNLGMSVPTFEGYLLARAAAEVNAQVAKVNPGMPDGGSGLTTADAAGVLAGTTPNPYTGKAMTPRELQAAAQLATLVDGLRTETLQNMVDGGQITPKLAAELKRLYPHYVPMRGREVEEWMESAGPGTGRGLSGKRAPLKRRLGRGAGNLPQNILGEMAGDFQRSAVARAKAKVNQAFLRFALANPMPELFTVEPVDLEWKYSKATGEAYLGVRDAADDLDRSMLVMHDGDPVRIRFEDRDLRDAMLNMGPDDLRGVVHILGAINRWRSKVLTQFNPQFAPVNITRDAIFGMSALVAEHGVKIAVQAAAGYVQATRAMFRQSGDQRPGDSSVALAQRTWDDWARDASEVGMKTGLAQVDDVKDLQRQMSIGATTLMQLAAEGKPWPLAKEGVVRALRPVVNTISRVNEASENALRLSAYVALRKSGMSRDKAAEYAKNMTINFNRKGQWGSVLNAIYLFYNASIQGSHAVVRVLRNPKVVAGLGALGALQGLLARQMMDDEEDDGITPWDTVPDYVRRTSLVIPLGSLTGDDKDFYALPMPYGFNVFTYTGGRVSQWMHLGARESDPSFSADVFKSLTESFSPIQINGDYGSLYGDQLGFAMQLAANRDDQGRPIAADSSFSDYDVPKALQGRATTPQIYERTAQLLAKLGGGNLQKRIPPVGYLDVAPEQLEAVTNYMGGGLLSMVNKSMRWAESWNADLLDRPMDAIAATPIASRFVNTGNEGRAIADRYYGERGELARKTDVLQDQLSGKTDAEIPEIIAQAGAEDAALSGIEAARYKRGNKATGKAAGDIKRTAGGNVDLEFSATSSGKAMQNAEKKVKALGKQINTLRDEEITVQHVVDIGTGNGMTLEQIGLPVDYDGAAVAPRRIRTRTIRALQEARAEAERQTLRTIEFNKRNRGPAPGLRESSLPEGRRAEYIGIGQGGRATPAPDVLAGAKNAPKMVMVGDYSGMSPELRKRFDDGALGVFDPRTKTAYVVMGLEPAEAKITAYHEIAGHYGLQGALGNDYEPVLNRARQNPLVRELADKMHDMAYKGHGNRLELTEEALSELAAARRAGDYERIEERWGVNIPDSVKPGLSGILARVMQMTRRKLADLTGDEPEAYDDDQVYSLIEDAWKHVEDGR